MTLSKGVRLLPFLTSLPRRWIADCVLHCTFQLCTDAQYQRKMLSAMKDVKGAHNVVGYYHTVSLGQFFKQSVVDSLVGGLEKTRHGGVVIVHGKSIAMRFACPVAKASINVDVTATARGVAAFKAFKLSKAYLDARKASGGKFNTQRCVPSDFVCLICRLTDCYMSSIVSPRIN